MGRKIKIGDRFGNLIIEQCLGSFKKTGSKKLLWLCRCDCGNTRKVITGHLGIIFHCGCMKKRPRNDLTGKQFGKWTVLKYTGKSKYFCRCSCGKQKNICSRELRNGDSKSCGCSVKGITKDLRGLVFGNLKVIEQTGTNKHRNVLWKCICNCGKEVVVPSGLLQKKHTTSCGCARTHMLKNKTKEQILERCLKAAKTANKQNTCIHWKTGEELICRASWEPKVIDYWNKNKIDFLW